MTNDDSKKETQDLYLKDFIELALNNIKIILLCFFVSVFISVFYALSLDKYYKSNLVMISSSPINSGNMSSIIGNFFGSQSQSDSSLTVSSEEAMAVLTSRRFIEIFIENNMLMPILFEDQWDKDSGKWKGDEVSMEEGYQLVSGNLKIGYSKNLVLLSFVWKDAKNSSFIVNSLVKDLNKYMSDIAISESEKSIDYLQNAQQDTSLSGPKIMLNNILERQLYNSMIVNIKEDFAFKIIDPAIPPKHPAGPNRRLIVIIGTFLGTLASILLIFLKSFFKKKFIK